MSSILMWRACKCWICYNTQYIICCVDSIPFHLILISSSGSLIYNIRAVCLCVCVFVKRSIQSERKNAIFPCHIPSVAAVCRFMCI